MYIMYNGHCNTVLLACGIVIISVVTSSVWVQYMYLCCCISCNWGFALSTASKIITGVSSFFSYLFAVLVDLKNYSVKRQAQTVDIATCYQSPARCQSFILLCWQPTQSSKSLDATLLFWNSWHEQETKQVLRIPMYIPALTFKDK